MEKGQACFLDSVSQPRRHSLFRGRPRGRSVNFKLRRAAELFIHVSFPNGVPRWTLRLRASSSASGCGAFTKSNQPGGRRRGQVESSFFYRALPWWCRHALPQRQSSAQSLKSGAAGHGPIQTVKDHSSGANSFSTGQRKILTCQVRGLKRS